MKSQNNRKNQYDLKNTYVKYYKKYTRKYNSYFSNYEHDNCYTFIKLDIKNIAMGLINFWLRY